MGSYGRPLGRLGRDGAERGHAGRSRAEEFLRRFELRDVPDEAIDAVVCSLAGYFTVQALDPPPPGIPTVRAFQAAQGRIALDWLRKRLGW